MGVRLEIIQIIAIVVIVAIVMNINLKSTATASTSPSRELAFTDTTLIEVTTKQREGIAHAAYGTRDNGILTLKQITYHNAQESRMRAKIGVFQGESIYLEGNVSLSQREGLSFTTEQAVYYKKDQRIEVITPFVAHYRNNTLTGASMQYDMQKEQIDAQKVKAVIRMGEDPVAKRRESEKSS